VPYKVSRCLALTRISQSLLTLRLTVCTCCCNSKIYHQTTLSTAQRQQSAKHELNLERMARTKEGFLWLSALTRIAPHSSSSPSSFNLVHQHSVPLRLNHPSTGLSAVLFRFPFLSLLFPLSFLSFTRSPDPFLSSTSASSQTMSSATSQPPACSGECVVCGQVTSTRCSSCASPGFDWMKRGDAFS